MSVLIGNMSHKIEEPHLKQSDPVRCFKCNEFHRCTAERCKEAIMCLHCGNNHSIDDCEIQNDQSKAKCVNCGNNHRANDKMCPTFLALKNKLHNNHG